MYLFKNTIYYSSCKKIGSRHTFLVGGGESDGFPTFTKKSSALLARGVIFYDIPPLNRNGIPFWLKWRKTILQSALLHTMPRGKTKP